MGHDLRHDALVHRSKRSCAYQFDLRLSLRHGFSRNPEGFKSSVCMSDGNLYAERLTPRCTSYRLGCYNITRYGFGVLPKVVLDDLKIIFPRNLSNSNRISQFQYPSSRVILPDFWVGRDMYSVRHRFNTPVVG